MEKYILYAHINKISGKKYVGITSQKPDDRWRNGNGYIGSPRFYNAILKYGWKQFDHIILQTGMSYKEACIAEQKTISEEKLTDPQYGYNLDSGGCGGRIMSEESRLKISANHADFSGRNHPLYGKKLSETTKQKIHEKAVGRQQSKEQKFQHSKAMMGCNNPRAKPVLCVNTGVTFPTARDAAKWLNQYDGSYIGKCCKGIVKSAGFHPETTRKQTNLFVGNISIKNKRKVKNVLFRIHYRYGYWGCYRHTNYCFGISK